MGETPVNHTVFERSTAQRELPKYRSHKEVHALKLQAVDSGPGATTEFVPADESYKPQVFPDTAEVVKRCRAQEMRDPGYIVIYPDGFISWSPTAAFEEGYTRIEA